MKKLFTFMLLFFGAMQSMYAQEPYAVLSEDNTTLTFYYDGNKDTRGGMDVGPFTSSTNWTNDRTSVNSGWDKQREKITTVVFDESFANCTTISSTACWFCGCENLTEIENIGNLNTFNVTDMNKMFQQCRSLTSLDVSNFNTANVKRMDYMFAFCSGLTSLDVSNFNTANVTNMSKMFFGCSGLTSLDVSNFNTANVTDMNGMFIWCSGLKSLNVSSFNTANVTNMSSMFSVCSSLTNLDVNNFNTANVTNMNGMFSSCTGLTSLNVSNFNTANVTNMSSMFSVCSSLTNLDVSNFDTGNVIDMNGMFYGCSGLTSLDVTNFNTANVKYMGTMFSGCKGLTSLDLSNFNTANVIGMGCIFAWCSGLTSIDVSNFNTANVTEMIGLFMDCSGLTSLDVSNFNTANATNISQMFSGCTGLTSLDVSNFNTANVTYMSGLFYGCSGLTSLNVSNFNTANATNISQMFSGCTGLTSLDVSNFNTANVKDMSSLFSGCTGLTNLDVSNFNTANATNISQMFSGCTGLTSLDVSNFNTANAIWMYNMFLDCSSLKRIYCNDSWSCEKSENMFYGCTSLKGTISYDENKTDITFANPTTGYFTKKAGGEAKVKLSKTKATIEKGKTLTLKATITPSDLTDKSVTWKSSNTKVATVTGKGKVKGVKAGTATITCTSKVTGAEATCKVTVGYVKLDKTEAVINKGKTMTLKATVYPSTLKDRSVTWKSSNTKIATVTSKGKVKGVKAGTATITCTSNATGLKATCTVTVVKGTITLNKIEACVQKGKTMTLKATVTPETLTDKSVTWESSNTKVVTVTSKGKVKGVKAGTATITCTSNATGLSATCEVTVGYVKLDQTEVTVKTGKTLTLKAAVYPSSLEDRTVTWESSNKKVATVTSKGKVKGIKAGLAVITCTSNATGLSTTCIVTVTAATGTRSLEGDDNDEVTEIDEVETSAAIKPFDVYDLSGRKVLHQVTSLDGLPDGIYIVNGKKILKKN